MQRRLGLRPRWLAIAATRLVVAPLAVTALTCVPFLLSLLGPIGALLGLIVIMLLPFVPLVTFDRLVALVCRELGLPEPQTPCSESRLFALLVVPAMVVALVFLPLIVIPGYLGAASLLLLGSARLLPDRDGRSSIAVPVMIGLLAAAVTTAAVQRPLDFDDQRTELTEALLECRTDTGLYPRTLAELTTADAPPVGIDSSGNEAPLTGWHGPYLTTLPIDPTMGERDTWWYQPVSEMLVDGGQWDEISLTVSP